MSRLQAPFSVLKAGDRGPPTWLPATFLRGPVARRLPLPPPPSLTLFNVCLVSLGRGPELRGRQKFGEDARPVGPPHGHVAESLPEASIAGQRATRVIHAGGLATLQGPARSVTSVTFWAWAAAHTWELTWGHRWVWLRAPQPEAEQALPAGAPGDQARMVSRVGRSQAQQQEVVAVGLVRIGGLMLREAQLELRVWEALRDRDELRSR